jgi:hypothetical protein
MADSGRYVDMASVGTGTQFIAIAFPDKPAMANDNGTKAMRQRRRKSVFEIIYWIKGGSTGRVQTALIPICTPQAVFVEELCLNGFSTNSAET